MQRKRDAERLIELQEQLAVELEEAERLAAIEEAAKHAPLEQLCLSPQCGFSSTVHGNDIAVEAQAAKLRLVLDTAREVWADA